MKSFRDRNPYAVGLVSLLILGALTGAAFMVGLLHLLEDTYEMEGTFTDAAGLRTGAGVKVAGVKVGRVPGIHPDRQHRLVDVTWVLDQGVDIGEDAGADIALETLLGSKYLRITDPAAGDRLMADLPRDERVIPHETCDADGVCTPRTTTPVDVFDLTRDATNRIEETDNDKLNQLIVQLTEITDGKRGTVTDLIEGIDEVATAINDREAEQEDLLDSADELAANLATKDQTLVQLIDSSKTILDFLSQRRAELAAALNDEPDLVAQLDAEFARWFDQAAAGGRVDRSIFTVGTLSDEVLAALHRRDIRPETGAITLQQRQVLHMLRDAKQVRGRVVPDEVLRHLPSVLTSPRAVLRDLRDGDLLYVFDAPAGRRGKIVVRLDFDIKHREAGGRRITVTTNSVRTAGIVDRADLANGAAYEILTGTL